VPTNIATIVSLLIAVGAVCLTLWQNVMQRRAAQAQVFLRMLDQFNSDRVFNGSEALNKLQPYDSLEAFEAQETQETRFQIYKLVEFLNDTARLVWSRYLPRQRVWDLYFMLYRAANEKLLPWWLEGQRQRSFKQKFIPFEEMCLQVAHITPEQMDDYDRKEYLYYSQKHHRPLRRNVWATIKHIVWAWVH
jgi:hypothetical protein